MSLFDAQFLKRCAYLDETARRSWGNRLLGRKLDRRWAGGSEFVGHTDYTSGDDFRYVDWHLCARLDELRTRQYRGSEDRTVNLLVDCSLGMKLGQPAKFDAARRLAGALAYMGLANLDRVGVIGFADSLVSESTPVRGLSRLASLLQFLDELEIQPCAANLNTVCETFVRDRPRRGLTILISDLFAPAGFEKAVDCLVQRGFQPYLLQVVDDREADPDFLGGVELVDVFGQGSRTVYLEEIDRINYRRVYEEFSQGCRRYCARRSIGIMQTRTSIPVEESINRMIRISTSRMLAR
jgi:uncharacterized protein (DUF58 family)